MSVIAVVAIIQKMCDEAGWQSGAHLPFYMDVLSEVKVYYRQGSYIETGPLCFFVFMSATWAAQVYSSEQVRRLWRCSSTCKSFCWDSPHS